MWFFMSHLHFTGAKIIAFKKISKRFIHKILSISYERPLRQFCIVTIVPAVKTLYRHITRDFPSMGIPPLLRSNNALQLGHWVLPISSSSRRWRCESQLGQARSKAHRVPPSSDGVPIISPPSPYWNCCRASISVSWCICLLPTASVTSYDGVPPCFLRTVINWPRLVAWLNG